MGNLVKDLSVSEMVATLEVLASHGLRREDLKLIRGDIRRAVLVTRAMIYTREDAERSKLLISELLNRSASSPRNSLRMLVNAGKFNEVHSGITMANFPDIGFKNEFKVYRFEGRTSPEDMVDEMGRSGYQPANLQELLVWTLINWSGLQWAVAIGQYFQDLSGTRHVPYVCCNGGFMLDIRPIRERFDSNFEFIAVKATPDRYGSQSHEWE